MSEPMSDRARDALVARTLERTFQSLAAEIRADIVARASATLDARGVGREHFARPLLLHRERDELLKAEHAEALRSTYRDLVREREDAEAARIAEQARAQNPASYRDDLRSWADEVRGGPAATRGSVRRPPRASAGRDLAAGKEPA